MSFEAFPKIGRLSRDMVITEKLDGTNAQVIILTERDQFYREFAVATVNVNGVDHDIYAGSRSRFIMPGKKTDNYGFAGWVKDNADELVKLGEGRHFGEWWGKGIQRGYGINEKRFSLFNVHRWSSDIERPSCCHVVPTLYYGLFDTSIADIVLAGLARDGSRAAPGFMKPEGIIVFHTANSTLFKKTIEKDEEPKSVASAKEAA